MTAPRFAPNVGYDEVRQRLRAEGLSFRTVEQPAAKLIARRPAIVRGFAFLGHVSVAPGDEGLQAFSGDYGATADALCFETPGLDMRKDGSLAQARCVHRFFDAVGEFGGLVALISHGSPRSLWKPSEPVLTSQ